MELPFSLGELQARLRAEGVDDLAVSIDSFTRDETYCLVEEPAGWQCFYSERGCRNSLKTFPTFVDAAAHFLDIVLKDPTTRVARPRRVDADAG